MFTRLILTNTTIDSDKLVSLLAGVFFGDGGVECWSQINNLEKISFLPQKLIDQYQLSGQLIIQNFEDKDDFREKIATIYKVFDQPTLLFLGDLSSYSVALQEGMLKLLEEPPHFCYPVITAQDRSLVLSTILSRSRILTLSSQLTLQILPQKLLQTVKTKLPPVVESMQAILKNDSTFLSQIKDISKIEREELDFWLWQIGVYLEKSFIKYPENAGITEALPKIVVARHLNRSNVQKKFVLASLWIPGELIL